MAGPVFSGAGHCPILVGMRADDSVNDRAGIPPDLLDWLQAGDVAVQYRVQRDLLGGSPELLAALQGRIPLEGFGRRFLDCREPGSLWWPGWYAPKWTSTHYTLLELRDIGFPGTWPEVQDVTRQYVNGMWPADPWDRQRRRWYDTCVAAMLLSLACQAGLAGMEPAVRGIVDYLLKVGLADGGWNCGWWRQPAPHKSSVHTTISVLEALRDLALATGQPVLVPADRSGEALEPRDADPTGLAGLAGLSSYRLADRQAALAAGAGLLLRRRIYLKLTVDEPMEPRFAKMSFPCRWHYDFLRGLEWFASVGWPWDEGLRPALDLLLARRRPDGTWPVQERHAGKFHFHMEATGRPSRWNTLRAWRVLRAWPQAAGSGGMAGSWSSRSSR